ILFFITLHQGAATRRNLKDAPRPARTLIRGGWLLVVTSAALAPFAVEPIGALSQVGVFAALMATMHVHVTHRWNRAGTVAADMRVTFWALSLPVVVSLALGFQQPRLSGLFDNPN